MTCRTCSKPICSHSDAEYIGIIRLSPATGTVISRSTSGAGGHRIARASVSGEG